MSTTRNNDNPGQSASPVHPSTPNATLPCDYADLQSQIPPTPDHLIATVAQNLGDSPRGQPMRVYLPDGIAAPSLPPVPAPSRFRDVDPHPLRSPWPAEPNTNFGPLNNSPRCPHQDVFPCFCRRNTDRRGLACQRCRFDHCSVYCLLQRGSVEELECVLVAELARERGAQQFEQELRFALAAARLREAAPADPAELQRIAEAGLIELERLDFAAADRHGTDSA
ncbi:uncharacterized protein ColSpa_08313 [Colletotrichum spaethianum]|uniref:Uncharacterized protein n=1 Tax=Colletotrichum spaethianum TaxID=700344 RepID=A0AA37P9I4_9PEZI|nr:uncharacterized protein ColSpa_08313 [Colletotrichum spaethianum]GKT48132.1 hypothetical protein ColSpa_08313 [Colletotrichum spaethianum]